MNGNYVLSLNDQGWIEMNKGLYLNTLWLYWSFWICLKDIFVKLVLGETLKIDLVKLVL